MFHPAFYVIHQDLPREGPGDNASTDRAFAMLRGLPDRPDILDVGCGPGMQTLELAGLSNGHITALDSHQPFLDELNRSVLRAGLTDRITIVNDSMMEMSFSENSFDVIWSEGAIFIIGFAKGLREWKKFLKPGGYLAVTEATWLKNDLPAEILNYWNAIYPSIMNTRGYLETVREAGYREIGHFILPASTWWDHYYVPLIKRMKDLKSGYTEDKEALAVFEEHELEIEMFRQYSDCYGYIFYIMQKPG